MGLFSRNKGKRGERELSHELSRVLGVSARRGLQFQGSPDSPDVVTDIPGVHFECKRTETLSLYSALEQAQNDAGTSKIPVVCHRKNKKPWVAIVRSISRNSCLFSHNIKVFPKRIYANLH